MGQSTKDKREDALQDVVKMYVLPDEDKETATTTENEDFWLNISQSQMDAMSSVTRIQNSISKLKWQLSETEAKESPQQQKKLPIWVRILAHQPKGPMQTLAYYVGFGGLMIFAIWLMTLAF